MAGEFESQYEAVAFKVVFALVTLVCFALLWANHVAGERIAAENAATIKQWEAAGCKVTSFVPVYREVRRVYTCPDGIARIEPR